MTACDKTRRSLTAYLDGEVALPERVAVEAHLSSCAACRQRKEELARADRWLSSAPEPGWAAGSTDALIGRLRHELAREKAPAPPPAHVIAARPFMATWRGAALSLAAVCAFVVGPALLIHRTGSPSSEQMARGAAPAAPAASPMLADARGTARAPATPDTQTATRPATRELLQTTGEIAANRAAATPAEAPVDPAPGSRLDAADPMAGKDAFGTGALARANQAETKPGAGTQGATSGTLAAGRSGSGAAAGALDSGGPLSALETEVRSLEVRLARVERSVSSFTTAARIEAARESNQIASRRFAPWR